MELKLALVCMKTMLNSLTLEQLSRVRRHVQDGKKFACGNSAYKHILPFNKGADLAYMALFNDLPLVVDEWAGINSSDFRMRDAVDLMGYLADQITPLTGRGGEYESILHSLTSLKIRACVKEVYRLRYCGLVSQGDLFTYLSLRDDMKSHNKV